MTKLLEEALARVARLPEQEQDVLATIILEELTSEQRWDAAFVETRRQLAWLAEDALAERRIGMMELLDLDRR